MAFKCLSLCGCAFIAGLLAGGCDDDDESGLKCAKGWQAASICCIEPDGDGEETCQDVCAKKCESDADCNAEGDRCQGGVCGPDDDCSL
ncbi:hypothetical protein [Nannocystis pusilla]|uniref:Lipoprotein n=1 Tax=Nannocystis pusilla TaxID=889268 RepID=A0ABS7TIL2_9BACT|nr:hypothetical protein [Nannocystis pusilla]MBZ5708065.1 hypothetical protein [Nannocystis pusilla]